MPSTVAPPPSLRTSAVERVTAAYRSMAAVSPVLRFEVGVPDAGGHDGDGPVFGRRLVRDPEALAALVAAEERRVRELYGVRPRRDVAPTWVLHRYAFTVALAMSGPWYLEGCAPRLTPDGVAYDGRTRRLVVSPAEAATARALDAQELRGVIAAHLGPVLEAFRPLVRRGEHGMWALVTDAMAQGLWHLGRAQGDPWPAAHAAEALLPGRTPPLAGAAAFRPDPAACGEPTRTRAGCCLLYTLRPEEICSTCPRRGRSRTA
ncbi:(2Fe-2S)-binding protein [Streptomyces sp. NPDC013953]|uniref:(2Fe-2S)-binding protein n=1 Tax=Streptomyces sp. NPDC013953 TaxID=3364868 RepID=UPI0036F8B1F9